VAVHLPVVFRNVSGDVEHTSGLGDIQLRAKYQFYRKDQTGKTFRIVAKTIQTLPTGRDWNVRGISIGEYGSYVGLVAGYETIKYGISNELVLKPLYPVKQINLYFEYAANWAVETNDFELLYAQGIQYAIKRLTLEAAIQAPLIQTVSDDQRRQYSILFGTRYIF